MQDRVARKLRSILNRIEGRHRIRRHRDTIAYTLYAYGHEAALVVAGLGLSHPVVDFMARDLGDTEVATANMIESLSHYPLPLLALSGTLLVFWILTRVTVNVGNLVTKVPLYRACARELGLVEATLDGVLSLPEPMAELDTIQRKAQEVVNRYYQVDGWPWPFEPPGAEKAVERKVARLCGQHGDNWVERSGDLQQREPAPAAEGGR
jgi:hypothetical protein